MTVKKMIQELKKMPQNLEVGLAAHDNAEWEAIGWPHTIYAVEKKNFAGQIVGPQERYFFNALPDEYVVLHC